MNTAKNFFTTIHLWLNLIEVLEVDYLSNKVCVTNKTEDLNLSAFNMITGITELKTLTKHILCECKCKFNGRKCNSDQYGNNKKCRCECKKRM